MKRFSVVSTQTITPSIYLLTLKSADGTGLAFNAGQYAAIYFRRFGRPTPVRCFSIVTSPEQRGVLQFAFRITGNYTAHLANVRKGETVYVQGPFGEFVMDESFDRNVVLLAGGIGITPFISMVRHLTLTKSPVMTTLVAAARNEQEIPFRAELQQLEQQNPNLRAAFVVDSADQPSNKLMKGRIDKPFITNLMRQLPRGTTYFVCGPPKFMDSVSSVLRDQGVDEDHLVIEAFGQRGFGKKGGAKSGLPKLIYVSSAMAVVAGVGLFLAANLLGRERAEASTKTAASTAAASTSPASNQSSQSAQSTPSTDNSASSNATTNTVTTPSATTTPTYTQTYNQPVSSVS